MSDCIFCEIVAKKIKADVVFETEEILAFKDANPQAPHHILVIPKKHVPNFNLMFPENSKLLQKIMETINEISIKLNLNETGFRIVNNCGINAGQTINHLHFHIIAGKKLSWP